MDRRGGPRGLPRPSPRPSPGRTSIPSPPLAFPNLTPPPPATWRVVSFWESTCGLPAGYFTPFVAAIESYNEGIHSCAQPGLACRGLYAFSLRGGHIGADHTHDFAPRGRRGRLGRF